MNSSSENQRLTRLAPLAEIFTRIDAMAKAVAPSEVGLSAAAGRALANDVAVAAPLPPVPVALRDGWATRSELVWGAGPYEPVPLAPAPAWVESGDPLPGISDAVLPPDAVALTGGAAEVHAPAAPGDGVLAPAGDARPDETLFRAGKILRHTDIAVLRAAGLTHVTVREPRVHVVVAHPAIGAAADAAGPLVVRAIEAEGARAQLERAAANGEALEHALADPDADAVVAIGGTGEGRRDASVLTLARRGKIAIHGMGVRPGESAALGAVERRPVLLLPGRLDAALAVWLIVGRRLLARLAGANADDLAQPVTLTRKIVSTVGIAEAVLLARCGGGAEPLASGHFPLQAMARADGWAFVPPDSEGMAPGSIVEMMPLP